MLLVSWQSGSYKMKSIAVQLHEFSRVYIAILIILADIRIYIALNFPMEGVRCAVFLICCSFLLKVTLSASIPTSKELIQNLEERVEELTETLWLLKRESFSHTKRQAATCILNENGRFLLHDSNQDTCMHA